MGTNNLIWNVNKFLSWVTGVTTVGSGLSYVVGSGLFVENHENHK